MFQEASFSPICVIQKPNPSTTIKQATYNLKAQFVVPCEVIER